VLIEVPDSSNLYSRILLPGPNPYPPQVVCPGGSNPACPPPLNPAFPPGPCPPGIPQGNPAFPPCRPPYPVPQPGCPGYQPSGPYPPPYPPPAPGMCPVNPPAPGMVGPGIVIDKKTRKKMKKAHKKSHKHHKHGKVSVIWSLAGEGAPFRGTRGDQELGKDFHGLWAQAMVCGSGSPQPCRFSRCRWFFL
jgi:hypothetical protein